MGASQLPLQYLLAVRSPYSPVQLLTRTSHEQLKSVHQILGRIIFTFFVLHVALYLNFFILAGYITKRIKDTDVILGLISITLFSILSTTSLTQVRKRNYRVFFMSHVGIANGILVPLYFHVHHIRPFVWEAVAVCTAHFVLRAFTFRKYSGSVKILPGTSLVVVRIPLSDSDRARGWKAGQHVYVSRPSSRNRGSISSTSVYEQLSLRYLANPFTVASIPTKDAELLLVARVLDGYTKDLGDLARSLHASQTDEDMQIPFAIEGPYGGSASLPDFAGFDSVLLVAGGVGATFAIPIWRKLVEGSDKGQQIRFVWAVRRLIETQWAFPATRDQSIRDTDDVEDSEAAQVEVFVTQPSGAHHHLQPGDSGDDIELLEEEHLLSVEEQMERPRRGMVLQTGRPRIPVIVEEVFGKGGRVAVLSCGPRGLVSELSGCVEEYVRRGREAFWYDEGFGW